ncbi:ABC transporter permease [Lysinibacillus sp. YS11]|uniref:ABC transporter permease n=1 Tax=Lysinibacillus TaxID=400634 RepID=UPI000CA0F4FC|nr:MULTISPECIES: ABC transporter permease [Lysinibacillus]AUS86383.1 ABC transporter permease [Lysinibacillus sp. YS11]MDP1395596.1 ABC transporter permease [Lysinibacillus capsici]MDP1415971.1 ABC transporter permease [Lysinibacillus capsici]MDP1431958.1 ABC transporter permease [Lysinibacillus capsici]MEC1305233.1 ABC transporter permease [Lysinibacillus capsici]
MLKLIQNEWMKLWHKKGTWAMVAMLILVILVPAGITKYYEVKSPTEGSWQDIEQDAIQSYKETLAGEDLTEEDKAYFQEQMAISEYRLANDAPSQKDSSLASFMSFTSGMLTLVTLFTVITAASIVSSEFSAGTIKMLLTRPMSRAKVLTSKLLTTFLFGLLLYVVNVVVSALIGLVLFGMGTGVELEMVNGQVVEKAVWSDLAYHYLLSGGDFVMSTLFAFLIGSVFRSSSLAIGLTMFLSFTGGMIVMFLSRYDIVKYIWLTHSDLTQYEHGGGSMIADVTLPFSLTVLAIYAVVFLVISYSTFMKRDVTA